MRVLVILWFFIAPVYSHSWGFFAHRQLNRLAVFTLPPEMIGFYKENIEFIEESAVNPDKRRYAMKNEAPRHYIDLDVYGDSAAFKVPRYWDEAVELYTEDTLLAYGIVPYHVNLVSYWLTEAFKERDVEKILRLSSDLAHYIGDANVPLHTTKNYNGQLSGQYGIHGFWESRLPELFLEDYDLLTGKASYVENLQLEVWDGVVRAHMALDSVLSFERELSENFSESKKYGYEERGQRSVRVYSYEFSNAYHRKLNGMVERQMRNSIKMIGDFWLTCWINAGQPDLSLLMDNPVVYQDSIYSKSKEVGRLHEADNK